MTIRGKIGSLVFALVALGGFIVTLVSFSPAANAATGDMNEVLRINDTRTVGMVFASNVQEQLEFIAPNLPFHEEEGVFDPAANSEVITVGLLELEELRMLSQLAPLAAISADTVKFISSPAFDDEPIDMFGDKAVCIAAATVQSFIDEYGINATEADYAAIRDVLANKFTGMPVDTITAAVWLAVDGGHGACGVDVSKI